MIEAEFLALPVEEQNATVAEALGWERDTWMWIRGDETRHEPPPYVNGSWAEFGQMWDALPRWEGQHYTLCEINAGPNGICYQAWRNGTWFPAHENRNTAVGMALLVSKDVIEA